MTPKEQYEARKAERNKLQPCPFCGGEAEVTRYGDRSRSTICNCTECGCRLETGEERDHGEQWNTRAALSAQPQPDAVEAVLPAFKPCFSVNEPMNLIEVAFEDASYTAKPLIDGVYHWIDQHIAHDDGRVVGLTFWMYKPPLAPDARMRRVLERIRDDGPDHGVRWCRNIASEALRAVDASNASAEARMRKALEHARSRFEQLAEEFEQAKDTVSWAMCSTDAKMMDEALSAGADEGKESEGGIMAAARKAQQRVETWSDAKKDYAERTVGSPSDPTPADQREAIARLAHRFWSIHPSSIDDMGLTREQFYAKEMEELFLPIQSRTSDMGAIARLFEPRIEQLDRLEPNEDIGVFDASGQWLSLFTVKDLRLALSTRAGG